MFHINIQDELVINVIWLKIEIKDPQNYFLALFIASILSQNRS